MVDGFIFKEDTSIEFLRAVEVIRNGGKFFSSLLCSELVSILRTKIKKWNKPILTSREKEILQYVSAGKKNQEIAKSLNISVYTVHRHLYNIKNKLNFKNMTELIRYCILNGISIISTWNINKINEEEKWTSSKYTTRKFSKMPE